MDVTANSSDKPTTMGPYHYSLMSDAEKAAAKVHEQRRMYEAKFPHLSFHERLHIGSAMGMIFGLRVLQGSSEQQPQMSLVISNIALERALAHLQYVIHELHAEPIQSPAHSPSIESLSEKITLARRLLEQVDRALCHS